MSFNTNWDISKHRSPHEPNYQWELRRKFMELNKDRFPEERLVCLAQTFANIEFMGCRYPKATMDSVEELSYGVVQEFREKQKNILKRTFVSGSDAAESKVNRRGPNRKHEEAMPATSGGPTSSASLKYGRFVSASKLDSEEASTSESSTMAVNQEKPWVRIEDTEVHETSPSKTTEAEGSKRRKIVWDLGETVPKKPPVQQQQQNRQQQLSNNFNNRNSRQQQNNFRHNRSDPLANFVIVKLAKCPDEQSNNILGRSASFCKVIRKLNYTTLRDGRTRCEVLLNDQLVASAVADHKTDARDESQDLAIETLSRRCHTLIIKNQYLSDGGTTIDVDSLDNAGEVDDSLQSNNVGHKLMQMMGWSGGGLGKEGEGISEPITAQAVFNRQGLGTSTTDRDFKAKIRKIVEEYAQSNNSYDLVFSSGFTNEQRKEMHEIARRLGLKSKSFGKKDDRFITISRKVTGNDIIQQLIARGGSNEKYELIPPQGN